jgi:hypothetical protein
LEHHSFEHYYANNKKKCFICGSFVAGRSDHIKQHLKGNKHIKNKENMDYLFFNLI